jgi:hypothetical protein
VLRRGADISDSLTDILRVNGLTSPILPSLGVAHGWAGLIFAVLRWSAATQSVPDPILRERLNEFIFLSEPHAGGLRWPVSASGSPRNSDPGWCNGTAGFALLFALAHEVLGDDSYADTALRACESAYSAATELGTLCCGLGGIGYSFLAAYRLTGAEIWLHRARETAHRAAQHPSPGFHLDSLYKGGVGVAMLAQDLQEPELASMPVFERIR